MICRLSGLPAAVQHIALALLAPLLLGGCGGGDALEGRAALQAREAKLVSAIAASPRDAALQTQLGGVRLALDNGLGAEAALRQAVILGASAEHLRPPLARAVLIQGETVRALAVLDEGPVHPDAAGEAGHVAGIIHLALGNMDAARDAFDIAVRAMPRDSRLWVDVGRFRDANADTAGARDAADYAIELDPDNAAALALKANLVRVQEGLAAALPFYEQALAKDPDNVAALLDHAATLGDLGQYRAMLVQVRAAASLAPGSPRPYVLQAVVAARAGDYVLARSLLQRTRGALDDEPMVILLSAIVELQLDGAAVAADHADRLVAMQPYNFTARRLLAAANWASGDRDGAALALAPIVARTDADSWSLLLAARVAAEQGEPDQAQDYFRRAASLQRGNAAAFAEVDGYGLRSAQADATPLDPAAVIPAIRAAMNRGEGAAALARAERLLAVNRGVADAQILYGDAALAAEDWAAAVRAFRDARALDAGVRTALRLVHAQQRAGDRAGAAATILALQQEGEAGIAVDRLSARLAMDLGQWPRAAAYLNRVRLRVGNRDVAVLRDLARAHAAMGNRSQADRLARLAVELQPLNRELLLLWAEQRAALGAAEDATALRDRAVAGMTF